MFDSKNKGRTIESIGSVLFLVIATGGFLWVGIHFIELMSHRRTDGDATSAPSYNLTAPAAVAQQTPTGMRLLRRAVQEINRNVYEANSLATIIKYLSVAPDYIDQDSPNLDVSWSGAFVAWLIEGTGNPDNIAISSRAREIWASCVDAKIVFSLYDKDPVPGDLVFLADTAEHARRLREGGNVPGFSVGVLFSTDQKTLTIIAGSVDDGVRLVSRSVGDPALVGFARLSGGFNQ